MPGEGGRGLERYMHFLRNALNLLQRRIRHYALQGKKKEAESLLERLLELGILPFSPPHQSRFFPVVEGLEGGDDNASQVTLS